MFQFIQPRVVVRELAALLAVGGFDFPLRAEKMGCDTRRQLAIGVCARSGESGRVTRDEVVFHRDVIKQIPFEVVEE